MKRLPLILCVAIALLGGCKGKPKEISKADKLQAENFISEAQFSMQIREYARAEELYKKAIAIDENYPECWVALGMSCRRQEHKDDARKAYQKALKLLEARYAEKKNDEDIGQKAWVMALLGNTDEAVKFLEQSLKAHPDSPYLREKAGPRGLPHTFQTSDFKALML